MGMMTDIGISQCVSSLVSQWDWAGDLWAINSTVEQREMRTVKQAWVVVERFRLHPARIPTRRRRATGHALHEELHQLRRQAAHQRACTERVVWTMRGRLNGRDHRRGKVRECGVK